MREQEPGAARRPLRRQRALGVYLIELVVIGYLTFVLTTLALQSVLRHWPPLLALLNGVLPFLLLPGLLLLPLALVLRSWVTGLGGLVLFGLLALFYGGRFLPPLHPIPAEGTPLKVMTLNLGAYRARPEQLATAVTQEGADVVAVQELMPHVAAYFQKHLRERYPYLVWEPQRSTSGLLSRYPVTFNEWLEPAEGSKAVLHAVLDVEGQALHVLVAHPYSPGINWFRDYLIPVGLYDGEQERTAQALARWAAQVEGPVLVLGDFNAPDHSRAYRALANGLRDAYAEAGWGFGFTFPDNLRVNGYAIPGPLLRIDYLFYRGPLEAQHAQVICETGSDHCGVVAEFVRVAD